MTALCYALNPSGGIDSKFVAALSGRCIELATNEELNHPILAVSHGWVQLTSDLDAFLHKLAECENNRSSNVTFLTSSFREVTYRAAELFEAYIKTFPATLPVARVKPSKLAFNAFDRAAKMHKRKWGVICNGIKHFHNTLLTAVSVENSLNLPIYGFTLLAPQGTESAVRNTKVHPKNEVHHSYTVAVNELLVDLLKTDQMAAQLVSDLPDAAVPAVIEHTQEMLSEATLSAVLNLSHVRFPDQPNMFNGFQRDRDAISSMRLVATAPSTMTVSLELKIGPLARSYEILPKDLSN